MVVQEIRAKSVLSPSKIHAWTVNPYVGCAHGCSYCYARFMATYSGHAEPWGAFVDAKVNAPELLARELRRKPRGRVWVSGVCDPYQSLEERHRLTRRCLALLLEAGWPVTVQTRSPLVLRDLDLFGAAELEVELSVTTADDDIRRLFEPGAPPIAERLRALAELHSAGVRTFAMIAPLLPGAESLPAALDGLVDHVLVDRMNYHHADQVYAQFGLEEYRTDKYFQTAGREIVSACEARGIACR